MMSLHHSSSLFIPSSSIIEYEPDTPHIFLPAAGALSNASWNYNNAYGFSWDGHLVWLSIDNQTNYKSAYDLAIQTEGDTLPYVIRVGADDSAPDYIRFNNRSDFADFYRAMVAHIQQCLADGWQLKDSIDWDRYEQALATL